MEFEIVRDMAHLEELTEGRNIWLRFLGEMGGYEVPLQVSDIIQLYRETVSREHNLIARTVGNRVTFSIGIPMTLENMHRMVNNYHPH